MHEFVFIFFLKHIGSAKNNECIVTIYGNETIGKGCKLDGSDCGFVAGKYKSCCCNTSNCNDDAFVEKCKNRALTNIPTQPKGLRCFNSVDQHKSILNGDFAEKCSRKLTCCIDLYRIKVRYRKKCILCFSLFSFLHGCRSI